jgi:pyruvate dehydrogenase E2 component (dihydrolipoamide acetyltransferase)
MPTEVILPKVDMDMATGKIVRWLAAEGTTVKQGQPLFEIETDKAAMEIEAPASGILRDVMAQEGAEVPVGLPVAWIYAENEVRDPRDRSCHEAAAPADIGAVAHAATTPEAVIETPPAPQGIRATPLARRLARQRGIDLATLSGSAARGRIRAQDILFAAGSRREVPSGATATWLREGEGVPIVLIHGFGSETASWRPFLAAFDHPGPVLSLDLPGHGAAVDAVAGGFDDLVAYAQAQLGLHGVSMAHLVGHSLGGAVATALAAGSALEACSLFLLAPAGLGAEINTDFTKGFASARNEEELRVSMRDLAADASVFSDSFVKATARARADGRLCEAQTRLAPRLFADGKQLFSVRDLLFPLAIPIKMISGAADRVIPHGHAAGLPGSVAIHLFENIGHMPHLEDRAAIARLLRELVRAASGA